MQLPVDVSALLFVAGKKAERNGDEWTLLAAVAGSDVHGQIKIHFDADPGIQPMTPFALESASADVRHVSAAKVRQAPRQEPS